MACSSLFKVFPLQYEISENAKNFIGKLKYSLNVKDHSYSKMLWMTVHFGFYVSIGNCCWNFTSYWSLLKTGVITKSIIAFLKDESLIPLACPIGRHNDFEILSFMNRPEFSLFFRKYVLRYFQDRVTQFTIWTLPVQRSTL